MTLPRRLLWLPPALALAAVLWACGGGGAPPDDGGGGDPAPDDLPGLEARPAAAALAFPTSPASPTPLDAVRAYPALTFARPVYVTHAPDGTDRLFVVEQAGRVLVFPDDDGVQPPQVRAFLDVRDRVSRSGNEEGLLGLAFDPDYARTGRFWVHYSAASPRRSVIARFAVTSDPDDADEASESVVLEVPQPYDNHNGGMLAFGPDRMLYVGLGDGGSANDPHGHGQDRTTLLGSLLRIDVRGTAVPYGIPSDNPFAGLGGGVRGEIWAYGIRNLWRFSFDRNLGTLWGGDVGQGAREEVNRASGSTSGGTNFGWDCKEGTLTTSYGGSYCRSTGYTYPIHQYDTHTWGCAIIGGYVYRGSRHSTLLGGTYVYGDYCSGRVWGLGPDASGRLVNGELRRFAGSILAFGRDASNELYLLGANGSVYRIGVVRR